MTRLIICFAILVMPSIVLGQEKMMKIAIIKADDVRGKTQNWDRFFSISKQKNVKVSAGIICNSLSGNKEDYFSWLRGLHASGQVEFWNHGWDHKRWKEGKVEFSEFGGSGYEHQKKHFEDSQIIMKRVLGSAPVAFGTPFNALDADTVKVMNENKEMRLFFCYQAKGLKDKVLAPMNLRGEHDGTGKPNFEKFKQDYLKKKDLSFAAIQFHPDAFSEKHFEEYSKILDLLTSDGWTFLLPKEYVAMAQPAGRAEKSNGGNVQKTAPKK